MSKRDDAMKRRTEKAAERIREEQAAAEALEAQEALRGRGGGAIGRIGGTGMRKFDLNLHPKDREGKWRETFTDHPKVAHDLPVHGTPGRGPEDANVPRKAGSLDRTLADPEAAKKSMVRAQIRHEHREKQAKPQRDAERNARMRREMTRQTGVHSPEDAIRRSPAVPPRGPRVGTGGDWAPPRGQLGPGNDTTHTPPRLSADLRHHHKVMDDRFSVKDGSSSEPPGAKRVEDSKGEISGHVQHQASHATSPHIATLKHRDGTKTNGRGPTEEEAVAAAHHDMRYQRTRGAMNDEDSANQKRAKLERGPVTYVGDAAKADADKRAAEAEKLRANLGPHGPDLTTEERQRMQARLDQVQRSPAIAPFVGGESAAERQARKSEAPERVRRMATAHRNKSPEQRQEALAGMSREDLTDLRKRYVTQGSMSSDLAREVGAELDSRSPGANPQVHQDSVDAPDYAHRSPAWGMQGIPEGGSIVKAGPEEFHAIHPQRGHVGAFKSRAHAKRTLEGRALPRGATAVQTDHERQTRAIRAAQGGKSTLPKDPASVQRATQAAKAGQWRTAGDLLKTVSPHVGQTELYSYGGSSYSNGRSEQLPNGGILADEMNRVLNGRWGDGGSRIYNISVGPAHDNPNAVVLHMEGKPASGIESGLHVTLKKSASKEQILRALADANDTFDHASGGAIHERDAWAFHDRHSQTVPQPTERAPRAPRAAAAPTPARDAPANQVARLERELESMPQGNSNRSAAQQARAQAIRSEIQTLRGGTPTATPAAAAATPDGFAATGPRGWSGNTANRRELRGDDGALVGWIEKNEGAGGGWIVNKAGGGDPEVKASQEQAMRALVQHHDASRGMGSPVGQAETRAGQADAVARVRAGQTGTSSSRTARDAAAAIAVGPGSAGGQVGPAVSPSSPAGRTERARAARATRAAAAAAPAGFNFEGTGYNEAEVNARHESTSRHIMSHVERLSQGADGMSTRPSVGSPKITKWGDGKYYVEHPDNVDANMASWRRGRPPAGTQGTTKHDTWQGAARAAARMDVQHYLDTRRADQARTNSARSEIRSRDAKVAETRAIAARISVETEPTRRRALYAKHDRLAREIQAADIASPTTGVRTIPEISYPTHPDDLGYAGWNNGMQHHNFVSRKHRITVQSTGSGQMAASASRRQEGENASFLNDQHLATRPVSADFRNWDRRRQADYLTGLFEPEMRDTPAGPRSATSRAGADDEPTVAVGDHSVTAPGATAVVGGKAGRWVKLNGKQTHIPHHTDFSREVGGNTFHSPAGTTAVYKDGSVHSAPRGVSAPSTSVSPGARAATGQGGPAPTMPPRSEANLARAAERAATRDTGPAGATRHADLDYSPNPDLARSPARSSAGRLRNYGSMSDAKLRQTHDAVTAYNEGLQGDWGHDADGQEAVSREMARRGLTGGGPTVSAAAEPDIGSMDTATLRSTVEREQIQHPVPTPAQLERQHAMWQEIRRRERDGEAPSAPSAPASAPNAAENPARPELADSPGRSSAGRIRNVRSMSDAKLLQTLHDQSVHNANDGEDHEAEDALRAEAQRRGIENQGADVPDEDGLADMPSNSGDEPLDTDHLESLGVSDEDIQRMQDEAQVGSDGQPLVPGGHESMAATNRLNRSFDGSDGGTYGAGEDAQTTELMDYSTNAIMGNGGVPGAELARWDAPKLQAYAEALINNDYDDDEFSDEGNRMREELKRVREQLRARRDAAAATTPQVQAPSPDDLTRSLQRELEATRSAGGYQAGFTGTRDNAIADNMAAERASAGLRPELNSPARSSAGRLRNFARMSPDKLRGTHSDTVAHGNDPEALEKIRAEMTSRGMPTPSPAAAAGLANERAAVAARANRPVRPGSGIDIANRGGGTVRPPLASSTTNSGATLRPDLYSPGRSSAGRLRNFHAMSDAKLADTLRQLTSHGGDPEAMRAAQDEARSRRASPADRTPAHEIQRLEDDYNEFGRRAEAAPHRWGAEQEAELERKAEALRRAYARQGVPEDDRVQLSPGLGWLPGTPRPTSRSVGGAGGRVAVDARLRQAAFRRGTEPGSDATQWYAAEEAIRQGDLPDHVAHLSQGELDRLRDHAEYRSRQQGSGDVAATIQAEVAKRDFVMHSPVVAIRGSTTTGRRQQERSAIDQANLERIRRSPAPAPVGEHRPDLAGEPGRTRSGHLKNFPVMNEQALRAALGLLRDGHDPEALDAARAEMQRRGLRESKETDMGDMTTAMKRRVALAEHVLHEAADSMIKASTPEPFSKSKTSNWVARGGGLPAYIQHIAHDLVEKRGKSESQAIQMAIGIVKRWAKGGGNVDATTRAAAQKAVAEWEALKAKAHAKPS